MQHRARFYACHTDEFLLARGPVSRRSSRYRCIALRHDRVVYLVECAWLTSHSEHGRQRVAGTTQITRAQIDIVHRTMHTSPTLGQTSL